MSDVDKAKERLENALVRLDKIVVAGAIEAGPKAAARIAVFEAETAELKAEIAALQAQNKSLSEKISQARTSYAAYAALEEVADAVTGRLETAIGGIRSVIGR
jgi:phage shock protein A